VLEDRVAVGARQRRVDDRLRELLVAEAEVGRRAGEAMAAQAGVQAGRQAVLLAQVGREEAGGARQLAVAGIRTGVLVAPVLPGLSDSPAQLEEVVTACVEAGARSVTAIALHLRPGVREHFMGWLRPRDPDLADDYERRYQRSYLPDEEQKALAARVRAIAERAGARYATPAQARVPAGEAVVP